MQRPAQHPRAEVIPVGIAVEQMQVPDLVNLIRRCNRVVSHHRQEDKPLVLLNCPQSKTMAPAIAAHQVINKADLMIWVMQLIPLKTLVELLLIV